MSSNIFFRSKQSFRNLVEPTYNYFLVYFSFLTNDEFSTFLLSIFSFCFSLHLNLSSTRWNEKNNNKENDMDSLYNFDIVIVFTNGHRFIGFGFGM